MKQPLLFVALLVAGGLSAQAQSLSGTTTSVTSSSTDPVVLSGDFIAYTADSNHSATLDTATDALNGADFSQLTPTGTDTTVGGFGMGLYDSYSGVLYGTSTPAVVSENNVGQEGDDGNNYAYEDSFSLTSKVLSTSETFNFFLETYNTAADFTVSLADAPDASLTYRDTFGNEYSGANDEEVTLALTGLTIGDTATFNITSEAGSYDYPTVGLLAVEVAPEPSTYAMLVAGVVALVAIRRKRSSLV